MAKRVTSQRVYVVLAASFFSVFITGYAAYHGGVMKMVLIRHLDTDVSATTWLMSYYTVCYALAAPVGSLMLNLTSCRTCVVLSGVLCLLGFVLSSLVTDITYLIFTFTLLGVGQSMCSTASIVILGYCFPERASIVTGVSISGGALSAFLHPPLLQALVDWYGLRGALMLSGAIAFHASALGALMTPCRLERRVIQSRRGGNVLQKLCALCAGVRGLHTSPLTSQVMAALVVSAFAFSLSCHSLTVLLPHYLVHLGALTPTEASFSASVSGIGSFISRLVAGFLAHDPRVGNVLVYSGLNGVQALVSLTAPSLIAQGMAGTCVYNLMMGLYSGGVFGLFYPLVQEIVGVDHSATAYGLVLFALGVGGLVGAPVTELVQESSSNPYAMFGFLGAFFCVSAMLGSLVTSLIPSTGSTPGQHKPSSPSASPSDHQPDHDLELTETTDNHVQNQDDTHHNTALNREVIVCPPAVKSTINSSETVHVAESPEVTTPLLHGEDSSHVIRETQSVMPVHES